MHVVRFTAVLRPSAGVYRFSAMDGRLSAALDALHVSTHGQNAAVNIAIPIVAAFLFNLATRLSCFLSQPH